MIQCQHAHTLIEHKGPIYSLCQGPEPHLFFSAGSDRKVFLWNAKEAKAERLVAQSPTTIISINYISDFNCLLIGQVEGGIHIIDMEKGKEVKYLKNHIGYIFDMEYIPEKKELLVASGDGKVSAYRLPTFEMLWMEQLSSKKIRKIDYSAQRKEIAIACGDGNLKIYKSDNFEPLYKWDDFESSVNIVKYHPTEPYLFVGEKAAQLHSIDLSDLSRKEKVPAHYWAIYDIQFSPNHNIMATASRDKTIKLWELNPFKVICRLEGRKDKAHTHSVNKLLWLNNETLVSAGDDGNIKIWKIDSKQ